MSALPQALHLTVTQSAIRTRRARAVRATLRVVHPEELARSLPLERSPLVLGRRDAAGIATLVHPTVSRRHVRLEWNRAGSVHLVRDLGSHNGSRVNGRQLATDNPVALTHGDTLQLGDVIAVYEIEPVEPVDDVMVSTEALPGNSVAMRRLRAAVARAGRDPSPVLLVGETGTGKEQVARELHRLSGRPGGLLSVNCAALSRELVESQLFGHVRGAFTGALTDHPGLFRAAHGGTVFLDEIGDLPVDLQPKLLRALQEGEVLPVGATRPVPVDVRLIAATNRDLTASVESGLFRRDLYARLAFWEISVPALRERRADLLGWIGRFNRRWMAERTGQTQAAPIDLSPAAAEMILLAEWPENLRGIGRLVHELASRAGQGRIEADELPAWLCRMTRPADPVVVSDAPPRPRPRRATPTPEELTTAMRERDGSVRAVARHYGRDRRQIYRWIEAYGLGEHRRGRR